MPTEQRQSNEQTQFYNVEEKNISISKNLQADKMKAKTIREK